MDYLVIGSNGFAQVGYPDFHIKNRIEMRVLLEYLQNNYPIPEEFSHMCDYRVKWFTHDFGRYSEIVLHNHPSGNSEPSDADIIKITKKLKNAGKLLDITLLDHLILLPKGYTSLADEGLL